MAYRQWQRLHGTRDPGLRDRSQSRPLLHSHSKPGIEWHLRELRQNLQARLCSREPSSGCDHRTPADRRMVLGLQRKPSPLWAQNALPKGVHASSITIALCPVKRGQLHRGFRDSIFVAALADTATFKLAHWSKDQLAASYVIPMFAHEATLNGRRPVSFQQWLETEPQVSLHSHHARDAGESLGNPYPHTDPATASWASRIVQVPTEAIMLLDGYHRAVRFWRRGEPADMFAVYVPA